MLTARPSRLLVSLLWLPLALVLTACSPAVLLGLAPKEAELTQRPGSSEPAPPPIVLRTADGREQRGGSGTYCWSGQGVGVCADAAGTMVPDEPLRVVRNATLTIDLSLLGMQPTRLGCRVYPYDAVVQRPAWATVPLALIMPPEGDPRSVALTTDLCAEATDGLSTTVERAVDLPPGHYALELWVYVEQGDTIQGFNLIVA